MDEDRKEIELKCQSILEKQRILHPCYLQETSFGQTHWVCSSTPMIKSEAVDWLIKKTNHSIYGTSGTKIFTSEEIPNKFFQTAANFNPLGDYIYDDPNS